MRDLKRQGKKTRLRLKSSLVPKQELFSCSLLVTITQLEHRALLLIRHMLRDGNWYIRQASKSQDKIGD